jgi:hypothetical protein
MKDAGYDDDDWINLAQKKAQWRAVVNTITKNTIL